MSRPVRSGVWTPSLWAASLIQNQDFQAAAPRTKKAVNEITVRRLICFWAGSVMIAATGGGPGMIAVTGGILTTSKPATIARKLFQPARMTWITWIIKNRQ